MACLFPVYLFFFFFVLASPCSRARARALLCVCMCVCVLVESFFLCLVVLSSVCVCIAHPFTYPLVYPPCRPVLLPQPIITIKKRNETRFRWLTSSGTNSAAFDAAADKVDKALKEGGGPYFLGEAFGLILDTHTDIYIYIFVLYPRYLSFCSKLPGFRWIFEGLYQVFVVIISCHHICNVWGVDLDLVEYRWLSIAGLGNNCLL